MTTRPRRLRRYLVRGYVVNPYAIEGHPTDYDGTPYDVVERETSAATLLNAVRVFTRYYVDVQRLPLMRVVSVSEMER